MATIKVGMGDSGDAVVRVHQALARHGLEVSSDERERKFFGPSTRAAVSRLQTEHGLEPTGVVAEATADLLESATRPVRPQSELERRSRVARDAPSPVFVVRGNVVGAPAGARVRAYDKDMRSETLLGEVPAEGAYEISYRSDQFKVAEKATADLRVAVVDSAGRELASSSILFNAPQSATIDLEAPDPTLLRPEYPRYVAELRPLLQGVELRDLNEGDIDFLTGDTGLPRERIGWLAQAAVFEKRVRTSRRGARSESGDFPPSELFYGWFREGVPDRWEELEAQPVTRLRSAALAAIEHNVISAALRDRIDGFIDAMPNPGRDALRDLGAALELQPDTLGTALGRIDSVAAVDNQVLGQLVAEGALRDADARAIGLGRTLHHLLGGNVDAVRAVTTASVPALGGARLRTARDLAALDADGLVAAFSTAAIEPPAGTSLPDYAKGVIRDIEATLPNDVLLHRLSVVDGAVVTAIDQVFARHPSDTTSTDARRFERLRDSVGETPELRSFVNLHPGLKLDDVLSKASSAETAVAEVKERVGWIDRVRTRNADIDLLAVDYLPDSQDLARLDFADLSEAARGMVIADLKAHQRVHRLGGSATETSALLSAGFRSAGALSRATLDEITSKAGIPVAVAERYQARAERTADEAALMFFALDDHERTQRVFRSNWLQNPDVFFKRLAGYRELFGEELDFCLCDQCQSVLSPAAYFVDLMFFLERHALEPSFKNFGDEAHPLHLRHRREDLWTKLELSCENTKTYVPTLDLVIEILEKFIADEKRLASVAQVYERLATSHDSIRLPLALPLERISVLLSHFTVQRVDVADVLLVDGSDTSEQQRARTRLGLSLKQYEFITKSIFGNRTAADIRSAETFFYDVWPRLNITLSTIPTDLVPQLEGKDIGSIDLKLLIAATALDRQTTKLALASDTVNGSAPGAPVGIVLDAGLAGTTGLQRGVERANHFTPARLDRLERFVRLWRHLGWTIPELDHVLTRLQKRLAPPTLEDPLDPKIVVAVARLRELQEQWRLSVEESCALWDDLPTRTFQGTQSLFDRLYNQPPFVRQDGRYPKDTQQFFDPVAPPSAPPPGQPDPTLTTARLLAALQVNAEDLARLFQGLKRCMATVQGGNVVYLLNLGNLSLLYRHASLARLLGLSIGDVLDTVATTPRIAGRPEEKRCILDLDDLRAVLTAHAWRSASAFSLAEVRFLLGDPLAQPPELDPTALAKRLAGEVQAENLLRFIDTAFVQIELSEQQSRAVVAANIRSAGAGANRLFEKVPGEETYRLLADVDLAAIPGAFVFNEPPPPTLVEALARKAYEVLIAQQNASGGFALDVFASGTTPASVAMSSAASTAFVQANLSATSARAYGAQGDDRRPFEAAPGPTPRARLRAGVPEDAAIARFANSGPIDALAKTDLRRRAEQLVANYHVDNVLASKVGAATGSSPTKSAALVRMVRPTAAIDRGALIGALLGNTPDPLISIVGQLERLAVLFKPLTFDVDAIDFVRQHLGSFGLGTLDELVRPPASAQSRAAFVEVIRRVASYAELATAEDAAFKPDAWTADVEALCAVLAAPASLADPATDHVQVAAALGTNAARVRSLLGVLSLPTGAATLSRLDELQRLRGALQLTDRLGIPAQTLKDVISDDLAAAARGAEGIYGLFRSKYPDEKTFAEKLEPFEDKLRSRTRDGLVEYLLTAPDDANTNWRQRFQNSNDLCYYFLIDVMAGGCARTSRLVAGISSLQLYLQRVLMNLEQGTDGLRVTLAEAKRREVAWRKNFQVWVANRKVFLHPENYIEPGIRDDKTQLFRELEDTLLQQEITEQSVLDSYAEYLHGFEELGRLRIAGAYHDLGSDSDLLHLFGATISDPPIYYYRTIRNLALGAPVFSQWQKIDLQVPVRKVSPIVFGGRLYLFWVETTTRSVSRFNNGNSEPQGYSHSVRTKFSQLRLDGRWTPPQGLKVADTSGAVADSRVIKDVLDDFFIVVIDRHGMVRGASPEARGAGSDLGALARKKLEVEQAGDGPVTMQTQASVPWDKLRRDHLQPLDNYSPEGWPWERVYPEVANTVLTLTFPAADNGKLNLSAESVDLWSATTSRARVPLVKLQYLADAQTLSTATSLDALILPTPPAKFELQAVNGDERSEFIETTKDTLWTSFQDGERRVVRLSSSALSPSEPVLGVGGSELGRKVSSSGIAGLLNPTYQRSLVEVPLSVVLSPNGSQTIDISGVKVQPFAEGSPSLRYMREIFFHIPFLIADHLNSQQKFADAQRWYHYLYDPTASDNLPWRYREFREMPIKDLRAALTDATALAAYRQDPFNPDAIARLRPGAYQKAIVMKYIDNLLDWGDSLFSQFTMESVNEAMMLYVMAFDILGPRPESVGPCLDEAAPPKTYAEIAPLLRARPETSDVLIEELEHVTMVLIPSGTFFVPKFVETAVMSAQPLIAEGGAGGALGGPPSTPFGTEVPVEPAGWERASTLPWKETSATPLSGLYATGVSLDDSGLRGSTGFRVSPDPVGPPEGGPLPGGFGSDEVLEFTGGVKLTRDAHLDPADVKYGLGDRPPQALHPGEKVVPQPKPSELLDASLVFCLPENAELLAYWDRVEDRLNKIRNCMDIAGVRRRLELFAPEIDPRMLIRIRAAGLSLDDVLNVVSGNLPPYRFVFLIDKAKQYAGLVQGFGNQLLSALEKRDGEELTRLRTVHEQNLLKLRSKMTQLEIEAAEDTLDGLRRQKASAEYRRDHYLGLVQNGLSAPERVQQISTHVSSGMHATEAILSLLGGAFHLIPDVGAPTSMKYGGTQLGQSMKSFAIATDALANVAQAAAASAGIEATFQRRTEEWQHQAELASRDLEQLDKQIAAAEIRRDIATEALKVHERSVEQAQEIFEFLRDRFTSFGRFTWISSELHKLHRGAFNAALSMARLAEDAFRFERPDDNGSSGLSGNYWDAANAGLLAGDRLMMDLQSLERRFIETNYRTFEIEQSFSIAQFAPAALLKLRNEGACSFRIPEWFFDLAYPGHYRRRIKAVRLTLPCVTGPHTSVGATLELTESYVRKEPKLDAGSRVMVPLRHFSAIAASTAREDAGVFEFSFRDERYMPFEGAGAESSWALSLPKTVRSFDYESISDVILRISYTASTDPNLRADIEDSTKGSLVSSLQAGLPRILSLRYDFPEVWHRLLASPAGTAIDLALGEQNLPFIFATAALEKSAFEVLVPRAPAGTTYPAFQIDGADVPPATTTAPPAADPSTGLTLLGATGTLDVATKHKLKVTSVGTAFATSPSAAIPTAGLDGTKLRDIWLRVVLKAKRNS